MGDTMVQIFGIHCINGLPDTPSTRDLYNIPSIDNISGSFAEVIQPVSSVYVASDPVGARIFIDGIEQTGFHTPSMIMDIPPGHHNIKLISPGYTDMESSMPLESGRTYNIFLTMGRAVPASTDSSGIIMLIAIGLGLLLIRNK